MLTESLSAEEVIATLRAHEDELRRAGIMSLSLFGSVARGEADLESDVDLVGRLDPRAELDLVDLVRLERLLGAVLGRAVDLVTEPIRKPRLLRNIERDRVHVF